MSDQTSPPLANEFRSSMALYEQIEVDRERRGSRAPGSDQHTDLCDGWDCPCWQEANGVTAFNHLGMLREMIQRFPDLVFEVIAEVHGDGFAASFIASPERDE